MTSYTPVDLIFNYIEPEGCLKEKTPLIFLHGLTCSKEFWEKIPQIAADATKRKTYVVDSRNHGDSPWDDVFNFDCNVDDLLHFMDTIQVPSAILIGHSMGGLTAMKTSLRAPERVEEIVIEDISAKQVAKEILELTANFLELLQSTVQLVPSTMEELEAKVLMQEIIYKHLPQEIKEEYKLSNPDNPDVLTQIRKNSEGNYECKINVKVIMETLQKGEPLMSDFAGTYEKPSLFIYGTKSLANVGADEETNRKYFPNAEMVPIKDATHKVHTDHPQEFLEALLNFLLKE